MPLINCKVGLSLHWIGNCALTSAPIGANANAPGSDSATSKITDTKLYVTIVTLSGKSSELLSEGFKRTVYWNEYTVIGNKIEETPDNNEEKYINELLDSGCQGVKRLFALAYNNK